MKKKINGKKKGSAYEQDLARKFREAGYPECVTSRSESKNLDDKGIDLCYTGKWQIQAKAQESIRPSAHEILNNMPEGNNLLFWKKNRKGTIVCMTEELFFKIMKIVDKHNEL